MIIGATTNLDGKLKYFELLNYLKDNFKAIEIHDSATPIRKADTKSLAELSDKGIEFTIHSATKELFASEQIITSAEEAKLFAEIYLASLIKAKGVIFHIINGAQITDEKINKLKELSNFAIENKIILVLENNSKGPLPDAELLQKLLKQTNMKYCVDLGHLNIHTEGNLSIQREFIAKMKPFIFQAHLHGNNAKSDQHKMLNKKQLSLLKELPENTRLIIETKKFSDAIKLDNKLRKELEITNF